MDRLKYYILEDWVVMWSSTRSLSQQKQSAKELFPNQFGGIEVYNLLEDGSRICQGSVCHTEGAQTYKQLGDVDSGKSLMSSFRICTWPTLL